MSIEAVLEFLREGDVTVGIDLSAQAKNTGVAAIRWDGTKIVDCCVSQGCFDEDLTRIIKSAHGKTGIDCPFGWPVAFAKLVGNQGGSALGGAVLETPTQRERLVYRETDLFVIEEMRKNKEAGVSQQAPRPLSVSSDRIAIVAMRLAGLRSQLPEDVIQNDGSGKCVEVYPAAALALWRLPSRGYKGADARSARQEVARSTRQEIVKRLRRQLPFPKDKCGKLVKSDHVLDAFLCAIIAKDAAICGVQIPSELQEMASREGWIHLPGIFDTQGVYSPLPPSNASRITPAWHQR